jgi:DNA repair photolyase
LKHGLVIYEPRGRAGEYAPLAVNLYQGCSHGCVYCYTPGATFTDRADFHQNVEPRPNILTRLASDARIAAATYTGEDKTVLLCFTCDPYQPINEEHVLTRTAIEILHADGFNVSILTKGGHRAIRDFDILIPGDQVGASLTFVDELESFLWEPEAALPGQRMNMLRQAHARGIKTWASLEPVISPAETLEIIRLTHTFIDHFKVGKLNYAEKLPASFRKQVKHIDWTQFAHAVIAELELTQCGYYIKEDLRRYLWQKK